MPDRVLTENEFSTCQTLIPFIYTYTNFQSTKFGTPHDFLNHAYLSSLNSDQWRSQDHYRVLGLSHLRMKVTPEQVKLALRYWILRWHPDKCRGNDHAFKCLSKAASILSDEDKRRSFDSVDPTFDERIPKESDLANRNFFVLFGPVFERNGRFSNTQPVPGLGDLSTERKEVEKFYTFWTNFDSWRNFEYLHPADEADGDSENRMDKRWKEKQAKAAQSKAKAADNARISKLVDLAYRNDPRILAYKAEDQQAKAAKKSQKEKASVDARLEQEAIQAKAAEEARLKEEQERADRLREKEQKELERNAFRAEKRAFKQHFSDNKYFSNGASELEEMALLVEKLLAKLSIAGHVKQAREQVVELNDRSGIIIKLNELLVVDVNNLPTPPNSDPREENVAAKPEESLVEWTPQENDILIKAVKMFPGGVSGRWQKITDYLDQHKSAGLPSRNLSEVTAQAEKIKNLQDPHSHVSVGSCTASTNTLRDPRIDSNEPTILAYYSDTPTSTECAWTKEEQAKLEKAMKMIPSSDPERWDKISKFIPAKSKKQIVERVKSLASALKTKSSATA
jgi:DnaJ homolog subfamily C member 2